MVSTGTASKMSCEVLHCFILCTKLLYRYECCYDDDCCENIISRKFKKIMSSSYEVTRERKGKEMQRKQQIILQYYYLYRTWYKYSTRGSTISSKYYLAPCTSTHGSRWGDLLTGTFLTQHEKSVRVQVILNIIIHIRKGNTCIMNALLKRRRRTSRPKIQRLVASNLTEKISKLITEPKVRKQQCPSLFIFLRSRLKLAH